MRKEYLIVPLIALLFSCGPPRSIRPPLFPRDEISFSEKFTISGVDIIATLAVAYDRGEIIDAYMLGDTLCLVLPGGEVINAFLSSPTLGKEF